MKMDKWNIWIIEYPNTRGKEEDAQYRSGF